MGLSLVEHIKELAKRFGAESMILSLAVGHVGGKAGMEAGVGFESLRPTCH